MFKKWMALFSKEKEEIRITVASEMPKKTVLDIMKEEQKEESLTSDLMNELEKFRNETSSLDYLRNEIEQVVNQKDGEVKLMEGFVHALKQNKQ